ncbi:PQQ-dependent sugar dehydrogenase [Prochlorococcus marinus XMU1411]|uniref:PQQ-dependent sugar dehydrogenase n=1 Tax=Prochlorococcus marinus TaxID=1219 RepID=UPI001ADAE437|nr:PQQ-dependent sugar dehydrogenase [Prochlorococcus marinus]MBO8244269.1 PQQ-dependent sugar dehydrogenase [Prochlorococcus marinus XMU1411]MBW3055354.1 hypothetical protein [Prochlorococcus marinus str. MU1411]MCR8537097.1 PQQ-dependent sugar dehydrogenase [Prochlorococcus marinus CUG1430]
MKKSLRIKIFLLLASILTASSYVFISANIDKGGVLSWDNYFSNYQKELIKKYLFPFRLIKQQSTRLLKEEKSKNSILQYLLELELDKKNSGTSIETVESFKKLSKDNKSNLNNILLKKYRLTSGFYRGINNQFPGSGYHDFDENDMIIISSRGVLAFSKDFPSSKVSFKQIKNNIDEYINMNQFRKSYKFSIKDLLIFNKNIYISYTEEISPDCWNTSVINGKINYEDINFKKLFSTKECVHSINNLDNEFEAHQTGGRMISFDDSSIILSIGDYRSRHLAQNINSINGKLIKINLKNGNYKIISMGHRNPQGLYLDKENDFLLATEHGPMGGDEINLLKDINKNLDNIYNFGWAISSAGEHYGGKIKRNKKKYEKYPLHNSHAEYGFIEPLKSFVPSIGISEIVKIDKKNYVVSSLKDKSLYFFKIKNGGIKNLIRLEIGERIRDLKFKNNNLYMFLEDTASIGILNINQILLTI